MTTATTKSLVVTGCKSVYTGTSDRGEYQIYEVTATDADGGPITVPLRSFSALPAGAGDFGVTPYTNKSGEVTYTLKQPGRSGGGGSSPQLADLQHRIEVLERTVLTLTTVAAAQPDDDTIPF